MEIDLRLATVAPLWFAKIIKAKTYRALLSKTKVVEEGLEYLLDLSQPANCMCGESHGFSANYYNYTQKKDDMTVQNGCSMCTMYSTNVYQCIKNSPDVDVFRTWITQYLDHIRSEHGIRFTVR